MRVIGIGDNVCDKYEHLKTMFPGGQALNFSVYAKMLGADSSYMGVFGTDEAAAHVISTLDELGIEHGRCRQYEGENGCARVTLVDGDRVFLGSNKGGVTKEHPLELTEEDLEYIKTFSLVHTSNNSYMDGQIEKIYGAGVPISYDFSGQWVNESLVSKVAPYASYVFLSCGSVTEEEGRRICLEMHEKGCRFIVATMGSRGALVYDGEEFYCQPPHLVEAVDTLGAGDSFAAAFLLSMTEEDGRRQGAGGAKPDNGRESYEKKLKTAMENGAAFAARTCLVRGAFGHGVAF